jgi:hypothetical protein
MQAAGNQQTSPGGGAQHKKGRSGLAVPVALLLGVGLGLVIGAFAFDDEENEPRPAVAKTTLERIVDDPQSFVNDPAEVSGQVREILSPRAFTVGQFGFLGPDLLVVTKAPLATPTGRSSTRPILEGDAVTVAGEVRRFDLAVFERDVGVSLRREFDSFVGDDLGERAGDPAVLADSARFSARTTPVAEARSTEEIVERPRDFYGRIVSVSGRVSDVRPSGALILDEELVALTADLGQPRPREGDRVRVVGPVRPLDPDQLRLDGPSQPDDEILGNFANRPAVVAQSIEVQADS